MSVLVTESSCRYSRLVEARLGSGLKLNSLVGVSVFLEREKAAVGCLGFLVEIAGMNDAFLELIRLGPVLTEKPHPLISYYYQHHLSLACSRLIPTLLTFPGWVAVRATPPPDAGFLRDLEASGTGW